MAGSLVSLILLSALAPLTAAHNILSCVNSQPDPASFEAALTTGLPKNWYWENNCVGYQRAAPDQNIDYFVKTYNDQSFPWQGIWPMQEAWPLRVHRAVNWVQETPIYAPGKPVTRVKPGATIMIETITNAHAHEFTTRPSGHYKIYLAGESGKQLTTVNQLTDQRVVYKAPMNKYSHITQPRAGGNLDDPGSTFIPFKLVDPSGAYLPEGNYSFVWTWWWATAPNAGLQNLMIPSFSSAFDVIVSNSSDDSGYLTKCIQKMGDQGCSAHLIGNTTAPGAADSRSPFPPYDDGYLTKAYNGNGSTADDQRTFQPFWTELVAATDMGHIQENAMIPRVRDLDPENELAGVMPLPDGSVFSNGTKLYEIPQSLGRYTNCSAVPDQPGLPVTEKYDPMKIPGASGGPTATPDKPQSSADMFTVSSQPVQDSGGLPGSVAGSSGKAKVGLNSAKSQRTRRR